MSLKRRHAQLVDDWRYITTNYAKPDMAEVAEMAMRAIFTDEPSMTTLVSAVEKAVEMCFSAGVFTAPWRRDSGHEWLPVSQDKRLQEIASRIGYDWTT